MDVIKENHLDLVKRHWRNLFTADACQRQTHVNGRRMSTKSAVAGLTHCVDASRKTTKAPVDDRSRFAFTIVELLVVVGVIGILAALILPSLSQAKRNAYSTKCVNNLRQLTVASLLYADDFAGRLPPRSRLDPWMNQLATYFDSTNLLSCPTEVHSSRRSYAMNGWSDWFEHTLLPLDYLAFQLWLWPEGFPVHAAPQPADTLFFGEKRIGSETVHVDTFQEGGNHIHEIDQKRHMKYSNYSFLDGSVRGIRQPESLEPRNLWLVYKTKTD